MRHSVRLRRASDKLIPSVDWKKSFKRSLTQAWGSKAHLSLVVKIWTRRLYFSHQHAPSEIEAVACVTAGDSTMESACCSQERWGDAQAIGCILHCAGSAWHISVYALRLSCRTANGVQWSRVSGIALDFTQTLRWTIKSGKTNNTAPMTRGLEHLGGYPSGRLRKVISLVHRSIKNRCAKAFKSVFLWSRVAFNHTEFHKSVPTQGHQLCHGCLYGACTQADKQLAIDVVLPHQMPLVLMWPNTYLLMGPAPLDIA